jgi:hypothetical protein
MAFEDESHEAEEGKAVARRDREGSGISDEGTERG